MSGDCIGASVLGVSFIFCLLIGSISGDLEGNTKFGTNVE